MLPGPQSDFIKNYLKPNFIEYNINTIILCYDHNWDRPDYPLSVLEDAKEEVDGVAWHWYGGNPTGQTEVYQAFFNFIRTGIEILRNHSKSYVLWNMSLDENNGPTVPGFGQSTCRGIVQIISA